MTERDPDRLAEEEAEKAAAEAAGIGGRVSEDDARKDPARRPVEEAGGGVSEGFELAEEELERQARHEDNKWSPLSDRFTPEVESDRSTAEYGEADEELKPDENH
jgi:hypothetical protein